MGCVEVILDFSKCEEGFVFMFVLLFSGKLALHCT